MQMYMLWCQELFIAACFFLHFAEGSKLVKKIIN